MVSEGPRGPRGERGETGAVGQRLPNGTARAVVALFVLSALLSALAFAGLVHYIGTQRAAQQAQGEIVERKLCTTLDGIAALRPPAGNPATNPSRAFDQHLHAKLGQLGTDLGCGSR